MLFLCIFPPESPGLKSPGEKQKCRLSPRYRWPLGCRPAGVSSVASPMPGGFRVPVGHGVDGANVGRGLGSSLGVLSDPPIMFASLAFNPGSPGRRKHLSRALAQRRWRWRGLHSISLKPLLPKQKNNTLWCRIPEPSLRIENVRGMAAFFPGVAERSSPKMHKAVRLCAPRRLCFRPGRARCELQRDRFAPSPHCGDCTTHASFSSLRHRALSNSSAIAKIGCPQYGGHLLPSTHVDWFSSAAASTPGVRRRSCGLTSKPRCSSF